MNSDRKTSSLEPVYLSGLLVLFCVAFWIPSQKMFIHWESGDNSYAYFIFPMFLYFCWEIRHEFKFHEISWNPWGLIPVLASLFLTILGELGSVETLLYIGMWLCIVGIAIVLYGKRVIKIAFPLIFLIFIVPLPPFINRVLTFQLKLLASNLAVIMLRTTGISVLLSGNVIDLGLQKLQVVDACSGLRYFIPLLPTALLIGYFFTRGWWRRLVLVILVPPIAVFINAVRVFMTGIFTVHGYQKLAEGFGHDLFGWIGFMTAATILFAFAILLSKVGRRQKNVKSEIRSTKSEIISNVSMTEIQNKKQVALSSKQEQPEVGPSSATPIAWLRRVEGRRSEGSSQITVHSSPFTNARSLSLTIIICLLFAATAWAIRFAPEMTNLQERKQLSHFPMEIQGWQGTQSFLSKKILKALWADDYVSATYRKNDIINQINLLVPFYEYQGTRHTAHAPQSCMLGSGWGLLESGDRDVDIAPDKSISIRSTIWTQGETKVLGIYFFLQRGRVITSPWMNKFYLMWDAITKRRTDGALVRMEMAIAPGQSMAEAEAVMDGFISDVWGVLQEYIPD